MKKTLDIKSVCECNRRLGCKTLHPQASIINLEHPDLEQEAVKFEFYAMLFWLRSIGLRLALQQRKKVIGKMLRNIQEWLLKIINRLLL